MAAGQVDRGFMIPEIQVRRAPAEFSDWESVRALIVDAFAYMEDRIDPPSSALRMTPQSILDIEAYLTPNVVRGYTFFRMCI
jgi:hypothetical protein